MSNTDPICKICYKSGHYNNNHNPDRQNITPLKSKIKSKQENKRISKKTMNDTIPYGHNNSLKMLKGLIGIYKSQDRQHNGKRKKYKRTNNDLRITMHRTKDRGTPTPPKTQGELMCSERVSSSCSTSGTRRVT